MAKSIRSKKKRAMRAIKRDKLDDKEAKKVQQTLAAHIRSIRANYPWSISA